MNKLVLMSFVFGVLAVVLISSATAFPVDDLETAQQYYGGHRHGGYGGYNQGYGGGGHYGGGGFGGGYGGGYGHRHHHHHHGGHGYYG